MKFKITYCVWGKEFSAEADTIAEAYEYIMAVIKSNTPNFPNTREVLSEYMIILADMHNGQKLTHEKGILRIDRLDDPTEKGTADENN